MLINFSHLFRAVKHSIAGLQRAWNGEQAFRFEVLVIPLMVLALVILRPGLGWSLGLLAAWLFLMALELLNSAIEEVFDLVSPEYNIHVKYGKDMASAAVLAGLIANGLLWLCMLWDLIFTS